MIVVSRQQKVETELRVAVTAGASGDVFLPKQLSGGTRTPEFLLVMDKVGNQVGIARVLVGRVARMEMGVQYRVIQREEVINTPGAFGNLP